MKEYEAQKVYDSDEDPYGDEESKNPFIANVEEDDEGDSNLDAVDKALKRMRSKKGRGKKKKVTDGEKDAHAKRLIMRMYNAAEEDQAAVLSGKPGFAKLKMLDSVIEELQRRELHWHLLAYNVLGALHDWIKPLPNGTLPNLKLRTAIIDIVKIFDIERDHLQRSKFGMVCAFLRDHKSETRENKDKLVALIQRWSRAIFDTTDDYRQLARRRNQMQAPARKKVRRRLRAAQRVQAPFRELSQTMATFVRGYPSRGVSTLRGVPRHQRETSTS